MTSLVEIPKNTGDHFFDVLHKSMHIRRHTQLFMWLQGELQTLLPHDVLLVAYGNFSTGRLRYDVISSVPGVSTTGFSHVDIKDLISGLFDRWVRHGHTTYTLDTTAGVILNSSCQCNLHRALRGMRSVLVQGMRDERAAIDVLYVAFRSNGHFDEGTRRMFEILLPHIDCASRRISALAEHGAREDLKNPPADESAQLTERESEILRWVSNGKTNYEIGIILGISPFTVKNHLQRIFRKIDVSNRAQAVSRFEEINRQQQ
ncbi:Transcriptional regulator EpsA [Georgfuchsia toluolica]|uniref:Transcriptional regulator EpsA n=1 Tax=Georgfuchsia toluolica TaxID=424218 RepID=A0A916J1Q3_9PROT|nr:XrtB/PEP-CTERM-associated transcriptional regulator EpsA [Georgfuchsia toluolica]CAG4882389.1 Transcriptional regulator EpsA [Georgfuchsia toluolica]